MNVQIKGNLVDVFQKKIYPALVSVRDGRIEAIHPLDHAVPGGSYILPGFIDAHVHIESSMLIPSAFARLAVVHGTVATVSDPHEIANVCGLEGVRYMIDNGKSVPFKFFFGAPSCVPATSFETAGAVLTARDVDELMQDPDIWYLSEMMNFPGVWQGDPEVMAKILSAQHAGKPVDGHAPGLRGTDAKNYFSAGISTDHECFTAEEALDKIRLGVKIIIREGSAARNFEALIPLLPDYPDQIMFCSDDKHPDSLVQGHINTLCARAVAKGIDLFKVLQAACVNPVLHYRLPVGLLRENDPADFIVVRDLEQFEVLETYIGGQVVARAGKTLIEKTSSARKHINHFHGRPQQPQHFAYPLPVDSSDTIPVIEALDGQLITNRLNVPLDQFRISGGLVHSQPANDLLKMVVVNRYQAAPPAISWIRNFGLQEGALASSVAHDSHNIIAVGVDDESLARAINLVMENQGGISCVSPDIRTVLALPVAGLMSDEDGYAVASAYTAIDALAKQLGCRLSAPFMTLSFMALLVIPHLKLSDLGLFDGDRMAFVNQA